MGKLALKTIALLLPFLLLAGYSEYRLRQLPNSYTVKMAQLHAGRGDVQLLVLGSSHAYHGIDPGRFDLTAYNMANSSQSLFYDCTILQRELERLKSLRVVVLPVSYFSLESSLSPTVEDWRSFFYQRFYGIPLPDEVERRYSPLALRRYCFISLYGYRESRRFLLKNFRVAEHIGADGWYPKDGISAGDISDESGKKRVAFHQGGMARANIRRNAGYLAFAIELLQKRGVTPVLVTMPVYATYHAHLDPTSCATMTRELAELSSRYGVRYLNYLRDDRFTRDDFFDNDHLNRTGATKFSTLLNADIMSITASMPGRQSVP